MSPSVMMHVCVRELHQRPRKRHGTHCAQHPRPATLPHQCHVVRHEGWHFTPFRLGQLPDEVHGLVAPSAARLQLPPRDGTAH